MIKANFKAYSNYVVDSLNQWDLNQVLEVTGLNLTDAPEVHFSNANVERAIVRQSTMEQHVVHVDIPNSLLQDPLRIYAHIGVYEGKTFKVVELVEIPVQPRKRPQDYQIEDTDEEVYSFKRLENELANAATKAQVANILANAGSTAELVDVRYGADDEIYASAGEAVRGQTKKLKDRIELGGAGCGPLAVSFAQGGLGADGSLTTQMYYASTLDPVEYDYDVALRVKPGYAFTIFTQNDDGSYTGGSVKTAETRIPKGTKFKIRVQTDPVSYAAANIALFAEQVYCETYVGSAVNEAAKNRVSLDHMKRGDEPVAGFFDRGSLTSGSWGMWVNYRVCTPETVTYDRDVTIYVKDGFDFAVHTFDKDGNFLADSSWVWRKTIEAGTPFKVVIKREVENTDEFADVAEFASAVYIATEFKRTTERGLRNPFRKPYMCPGKSPLVGHRGLMDHGDLNILENTVAAFEYAGRRGIWAVETDIHETADGHFVCIHDPTLDRTTTGTGNVADKTLAEIRALSIKDWAGNATEHKVPTFEEYLAVCKIYGIVPLIEIKAITKYSEFFRIIRNMGFMDTAMLTGGLWRLDTIRNHAPDILYIVLPTQTDYAEVYNTVKHYDSVGVSLLYTNETLTEEVIHQMHESDIFVQLWSINDTEVARSWLAKGADAVVTDYLTTEEVMAIPLGDDVEY